MNNDKNHPYSPLELVIVFFKRMDKSIEEWVNNFIDQFENQGQKE